MILFTIKDCPFCSRDYVQVDTHVTNRGQRMISFFCHDCKRSADFPNPSPDLLEEGDKWQAKRKRDNVRIPDLSSAEMSAIKVEWASKRGDSRLPPAEAR